MKDEELNKIISETSQIIMSKVGISVQNLFDIILAETNRSFTSLFNQLKQELNKSEVAKLVPKK